MIDAIGHFHPALVHFPVALIVTAAVAEVMFIVRKRAGFAEAAKFMIIAGAWIALPAAVAGFAAASGESFAPELRRSFTIHRIAGITTPVLAVLAAGMLQSSRRSGQVWEQLLYRVFMMLAATSAIISGIEGGELVHNDL